MRLVLIAIVVAGCGSKEQEQAAPLARPSVTDPIGFCDRATTLLRARQKCFSEDTSLRMAIDEVAKIASDAPTEAEGRRRSAAKCAVILEGLMRVQQPKDCPLDVTESERGELTAFLGAWYGERTAAPTTGDAEIDAELTKIAAGRDAACACKDATCVRTAATDLDKEVGGLPSSATVARAAATKMVDEVSRCRERIAFGR